MSNQTYNITLDFSDIHSFGELKDLKTDLETGGIYIWGFVFEKDDSGEPTDKPLKYEVINKFDDISHCFIPYYVGKSINNIHERLISHQTEASQKYLMFQAPYLRVFFKDPKFPSKKLTGREDKPRAWYVQNQSFFRDKILYYKCKPMLEDIYSISTNGPDALTKIGDGYTFSSLERSLRLGGSKLLGSVQSKQAHYFDKNQFFIFAPMNCNFINHSWLEAYVYYSLKGKTISQHEELAYLENEHNQCEINIKINSEFQYVRNLFKDGTSDNFSGYART